MHYVQEYGLLCKTFNVKLFINHMTYHIFFLLLSIYISDVVTVRDLEVPLHVTRLYKVPYARRACISSINVAIFVLIA